jgi:hypothetical protein
MLMSKYENVGADNEGNGAFSIGLICPSSFSSVRARTVQLHDIGCPRA